MSPTRATQPNRHGSNFHLRDLVDTSWQQALERIGRDAASRYGHNAEDGAQEAWVVALEHWQRGYPPAEVLRLVRRDLDSRWSSLRTLAHDDPRSPRSRSKGGEGPRRRSHPVPITTLDRLLASLTASTLGGQLDRLATHATLACPECGRRGHWECEAPAGTRRAKQRARGWVLSAAADAEGMEAGTPTAGGNRSEETRPAQCVAGTEPVWVCGGWLWFDGHASLPGRRQKMRATPVRAAGWYWHGRRHWTRQPVAVLREGGNPDEGQHVHPVGGDTGRVEREFVDLCDELAMERRRADVTRWQDRNERRSRPALRLRPTSLTSPGGSTSAEARLRAG